MLLTHQFQVSLEFFLIMFTMFANVFTLPLIFSFLSFHRTGHMLTHRSKKPYECAVDNCGKSYCDIRSLRRHFESQHPGLTMEDHMNYTGDEKDPELMAAEAAAQASQQTQQALAVAAAAANSNPSQYMMTNMSGGANSGTMNQMLQTPPNPSPSPEGSSSSSAALQFLAQAAQKAQGIGPLQPSPPPHSQSPVPNASTQGNSQIPVPQDVPGLFRIDEYANQGFPGITGTTTSQSVPTSGTPPVFKFQQNNLSNPLLRPMLSTRDAMLGTSSGSGKSHSKG